MESSSSVVDGRHGRSSFEPEQTEQVAARIVALGYDRDTVQSSLERLKNTHAAFTDVDSMAKAVEDDLQQRGIYPVDRSKTPYEKMEERQADIVGRLKAVVAIPSIVDVCNGLRRWYDISPEDEVSVSIYRAW